MKVRNDVAHFLHTDPHDWPRHTHTENVNGSLFLGKVEEINQEKVVPSLEPYSPSVNTTGRP